MKTDKQIQQDVIAELKWEPSVNEAHIGVEVKDGIVTLAGHVASFAEKWNAERRCPTRVGREGTGGGDGRPAGWIEPENRC